LNVINRYIEKNIEADLTRKMVFLAGPRQVGKTTFAKFLLNKHHISLDRYLNWDVTDDREHIIKERFPAGPGLVVLDEIHKYSRWRQVVKGLYDKRHPELNVLVTGSARLDHYRHGGDSLQGRYHFYRMHPLSLAELDTSSEDDLKDLLMYGGFPEPFFMASEIESKRWSREYRSRLIREDLIDLERVRDVGLMESLAIRLPDLVGSPLSINALREDLHVSHKTVSRWLTIFENLYMIFRIYPFGAPKIRAVKKEAKHYHVDWNAIKEAGARFENLVACHLMKWCHFFQDTEGREVELRYFRDIDRREVDFVIMEDNSPICFVECKNSDKDISRSLKYLKTRFPGVKAVQISLQGKREFISKDDIVVMPANKFLSGLI
jgi:predicted AAA+ superfamily ATPase